MTRNPLTTEFPGVLCLKNRGLHARPVYLIWPTRHCRNSPVICDKAYLPVATAPTVVSWYRKSHLHAVRSAEKVTFGYGVGEKPYTFSPFMSAVNAALSKKMEMPVSLPLCIVKNSGTSNIAVAPAGVFTK